MEKLLGCGPGLLISCSVLPDLSLFLALAPSWDLLSYPGALWDGEGIPPDQPRSRLGAGLCARCPGEEPGETSWPGRHFCLLDPNMFPKQREPCEGSVPE